MESRSANPFFEPLVSDPSSSDPSTSKGKSLPIRIQMEGDASELMKKNKKGKVNCSVERKTATQIIASEPKLVSIIHSNVLSFQITGGQSVSSRRQVISHECFRSHQLDDKIN